MNQAENYYMILESDSVNESLPKEKPFTINFTSIGSTVNDHIVKGPFIDALRWDYFCQHFYEWLKL